MTACSHCSYSHTSWLWDVISPFGLSVSWLFSAAPTHSGVTPWKMTVAPCAVGTQGWEHIHCQLTQRCHCSHRKMNELMRKISNYSMMSSLCLCFRILSVWHMACKVHQEQAAVIVLQPAITQTHTGTSSVKILPGPQTKQQWTQQHQVCTTPQELDLFLSWQLRLLKSLFGEGCNRFLCDEHELKDRSAVTAVQYMQEFCRSVKTYGVQAMLAQPKRNILEENLLRGNPQAKWQQDWVAQLKSCMHSFGY